MPSNWPELLERFVTSYADARAESLIKKAKRDDEIRMAIMTHRIPVMSAPSGVRHPFSVTFSVPYAKDVHDDKWPRMSAMRSVIDRAIEGLDTQFIPVIDEPKVSYRFGQVYLVTTLRTPRHTYIKGGRSQLVPARLDRIRGIDVAHISAYTSGVHLALKTTCPPDSPCSCREKLPKYWQRAWVMFA